MKKILATLILSGSLLFADNNSIGLDTVVGATLGVAIGNQIGKGNGKDVARVAGGLLGASIANNSRTPSYNNDNVYYDNNSYNNGYERSTTYVRNNYYYDNYDRYYVYDRPAPNVTIVYRNYDTYYPKHSHYRGHNHRDFDRHHDDRRWGHGR